MTLMTSVNMVSLCNTRFSEMHAYRNISPVEVHSIGDLHMMAQ